MTNQELLDFTSKLDNARTFVSIFGAPAFGGIERKLKFLERSYDRLVQSVVSDLPAEPRPAAADIRVKLDLLYAAAKSAIASGTYGVAFAPGAHTQQHLIHPDIQTSPDFCGREIELASLDQALWHHQPRSRTADVVPAAVLVGLGGVGKTSLAQEYGYRNRDRYQGVWWIRAETRDTLLDDLIELGSRFDSGLTEVSDRHAAARSALDLIAQRGQTKPWLLIYDNVELPADLDRLRPKHGAHIVITSRWSKWYGSAVEISVEVFARAAAVAYLTARAHQHDEDSAGRLADALGCLPLALAHARAYCWDLKLSFDQYREKLPQLIKKAPRNTAYPATVSATFELALEGVVAHCPEAERLMGLFAVLAPDRIPLKIFNSAAISEIELGEAVAALAEVSLIRIEKFDDGAACVSVHRLVQEVMRARLMIQRQHEATVALAVTLLNDLLPYAFNSGELGNWPAWTRLLPHAQALFPIAPETGEAAQKTAMLLKHSALYCKARAEYALAEARFRRSLAIAESVLGPDHEDISFILNDFCVLLMEVERLDEAERLIRRALAIEELAHGANHPGVAIRLNNLAYVLHEQGYNAEAERLLARAIAIEERKAGPGSPRLSTRQCNLARVFSVQGRDAEAEELYRRSLAAAEIACGPNHPDVANRLTNLAHLLTKTDQIGEAETLYRRALAIEEAAFGPNHPYVADDLANLAQVLNTNNCGREAEPLLRRAVCILDTTLPPGHTWIARRRRQLADLEVKLSKNASRGSATPVSTRQSVSSRE